ncbi:MAG: type II toxin-antitoxin system HicB family antitoxin [Planctomycetota bacterium]
MAKRSVLEGGYLVRSEITTDTDESGALYFVAKAIDLPGCISDGTTESEALRNLFDAAADYIRALESKGLPIPKAPNLAVKFDSVVAKDSAFAMSKLCGALSKPARVAFTDIPAKRDLVLS